MCRTDGFGERGIVRLHRISRRAFSLRGRALVTGAGPIGPMACLLGAVGRSAARRLGNGGIMFLTGIMNLGSTLDVDATTSWTDALDRQPEDVKVVVDLTE
jgi:hypothetical protein